MTMTADAEFYRYQRLLGLTEDGLQMKVTVITDATGRVKSASIQLRAVTGPVNPVDYPAKWSKAYVLKLEGFGDDEFRPAS
jgi:hypothetical protein